MDLCDSVIPEFVSPADGLMACAEPTWWLIRLSFWTLAQCVGTADAGDGEIRRTPRHIRPWDRAQAWPASPPSRAPASCGAATLRVVLCYPARFWLAPRRRTRRLLPHIVQSPIQRL